MINSFGPGNQKKPAKPGNKKGVKKNINPVATNTPMGGTPAANPMGGAQMDFDMPDMSGMGGMQMNTPSPMGGGNYEDLMMGMTAINGEQPSGANVIKSPEGPTTAGGWRNELPGIAGMSSMGAQPTGMAGFAGAQSPQVAGWNDPAMGGFQMDTPMMNDPMMGQPDMGGMQMDTPMMNDPMMGGMQMGQPDMGEPFMGDPMMGQFQQPPGQQPPPGLPPQGDAPDGWQGEFPANPISGPFEENKAEYEKWMESMVAGPRSVLGGTFQDQLAEQDKIIDEINAPKPQDKKPRPTIPGRSSFAGGQAPAGGDALGDAFRGSQAVSSVAPPVSQAPPLPPIPDPPGPPTPPTPPPGLPDPYPDPPVPPPVAPTVSEPAAFMPPVGQPDWKGDDTPEPSRRKPYMPPSQGPAGMPMDSELEAEWREKNPNEPLPELDDTPEPVLKPWEQPFVSPKDTPRTDRFISKRVERPATPADDAGEKTELEPGRNYGTDPDPRAVGPPMVTPKDKPALEEFKDKVDAGEVSDEGPVIESKEDWKVKTEEERKDYDEQVRKYNEVSDEGPAGSTGPVSEGAMQNEKNWDTVDGEYKFMGADYHKQNTRPEADTKDWEETREEAAEDIKEGDKFSEVGDAAYGTSSSASRSAANEADASEDGYWNEIEGFGSPPPISLPPTQPPNDKAYYDKLVNPDPFKNPAISLPPSYGKGEGPGSQDLGDEFHKYQGRKYDVDPKEILTEEGYPVMPSDGIDSNAGGMTVADVRRRGTSPAQVQALVNNAVAQSYGNYNQGIGGGPGALPGMSAGLAEQAENIGAQVQQRMASGQAQVDIPWQYQQQNAEQVRQRRDLAHKLGLEEAGMITGDYYDYLGDKMGYADTDNRIMQQFYGEQAPAFG